MKVYLLLSSYSVVQTVLPHYLLEVLTKPFFVPPFLVTEHRGRHDGTFYVDYCNDVDPIFMNRKLSVIVDPDYIYHRSSPYVYKGVSASVKTQQKIANHFMIQTLRSH